MAFRKIPSRAQLAFTLRQGASTLALVGVCSLASTAHAQASTPPTAQAPAGPAVGPQTGPAAQNTPAPNAAPLSSQPTDPAASTVPADNASPIDSASPAAGQQASPDIVVVGSRVQRAGYTSPTPQTNLSTADIAKKAPVDVAEVINQIPAVRPSITSTSNDNRQFAIGANYADIRGLGSVRTLVLVDRERFVPEVSYGGSNQVDLNVIPTIAIQNVSVVTGGASAAWGSDALAGVLNLQLFHKYEGVKVDASSGISERGDGAQRSIAILAGHDFLDNRLHVVVAGTYDKFDSAGDIFTRDWGKNAPYTVANASCTNCFTVGTGYQYSAMAPGGLIVSSVLANGKSSTLLKGTAFGANGTPYAFPYGTFVNGANELGGSVPGNYPQSGVNLLPDIERGTAYASAMYDASDKLTLRANFNFARQRGETGTKQYFQTYNILSGNPFIPTAVQAQMTANGISSINVGVLHNNIDTGRVDEVLDTQTVRGSVGANYKISDAWSVDAYYEYGRSTADYHYSGLLNRVNALQAANAVLVNGQVTCANQSNGCVPLNVFGTNALSPAVLNFIVDRDAFSRIVYTQSAAAIDVQGQLFHTWAGPISIAFGGAYRRETQQNSNDALQVSGVLNDFANQNWSGRFDVKEAYVEGVVPLLHDVRFAEAVDVNAGYRRAQYSTIGGADTWKAGVTWKVGGGLLLRASTSRDFRAPNLTELYSPRALSNANTVVSGQTQLAAYYAGGNPNLLPETSRNTTFGFTYQPTFFRGFNATVDYYKLDLKNIVYGASSANILVACSAGNALSCSQIVRDSNGIVTTINGGNSNLSQIDLRGIDFEVSYASSLERIGLPGRVNFRGFGTYTDRLRYLAYPGGPLVDYSGQTEAGVAVRSPFFVPKLKTTATIGYDANVVWTNLDWTRISASSADKTLTLAQYSALNIPSYNLFNLAFGFRVGAKQQFELYGSIKNLFDKDPPYAANLLLFIPTNPALYDTIGRNFRAGVRMKF